MSKNGGGRHMSPNAALAQMAAQAQAIEARPEAQIRALGTELTPHPFDGARAVGYWVLCEMVTPEETTASGNVLIPEASRRKVFVVLSVGPDVVGISEGDLVFPTAPGGPAGATLEGRTFTMLLQGKEAQFQQIGAILSADSIRRPRETPKPLIEATS